MDWEKILTEHIFDKGFVSRVIRREKPQFFKMSEKFKHFTKGKYGWQTNK